LLIEKPVAFVIFNRQSEISNQQFFL